MSVPLLLALLVQEPAPGPPPAPLFPRAALFAPLERSAVRLSLEGTHVGWIGLQDGVRRLWVASVDAPAQATCLTPGEGRDVLDWRWGWTREHVLYTRGVGEDDEGGGVDEHLFVVPKLGGSTFDVTPDAVGPTRLVDHSPLWPTSVALEYQPPGEERGLWYFDFVEKARHRMADGGFERYALDGNLWPQGASGWTDDGFLIARMDDGERRWVELARVDALSAAVSGVVANDFDGNHLYFVHDRGSGRTALEELDLRSGERRVLVEDPRADLSPDDVFLERAKRAPLAVAVRDVRRRWVALDEAVAGDLTKLEALLEGDVDLVDASADGARWLVRELDGGPGTYHLYERGSGELRRLFSALPAVDGLARAQRSRRVVPARDGLGLPCDVYLPPGSDADGDGRPEEPLPTVVYVHGGPWSGHEWNRWDANRCLELLTDRGYAAIRADFRGSGGWGREWLLRGDGEFGGAMVDDVVDVARWAAASGVADPERIALWGGSYGGYATLVALTRHPDVFACGLALQPLTDLVAFLEGLPDAWTGWWFARVGDPTTEAGRARLVEQSPIHHVEALAAPLLVSHGGADAVVPLAQSERFVAAAAAAGKAVTLLVHPGEGHDYGRPSTWTALWAVAERFLAEHLGGAAEPFGSDLGGAGLEARVGAERVPGLEAALGDD